MIKVTMTMKTLKEFHLHPLTYVPKSSLINSSANNQTICLLQTDTEHLSEIWSIAGFSDNIFHPSKLKTEHQPNLSLLFNFPQGQR